MRAPQRKPSLWWLALAPLVFILGVGGGTALLIRQVLYLPAPRTFLVPSVQTFEVTKPGTYLLWHDYRILFQNKAYNKPPFPPDQTQIHLRFGEREIPSESTWGTTTTSGIHEKKEIGRYALDAPGTYTLSVSGLEETHVFSFGRSGIQGIIWAAIACLFLNLLGWFGAPILIAAVLILRERSRPNPPL